MGLQVGSVQNALRHNYWTLMHWQLYILQDMGRTTLRK